MEFFLLDPTLASPQFFTAPFQRRAKYSTGTTVGSPQFAEPRTKTFFAPAAASHPCCAKIYYTEAASTTM